MPQFDSRPFNTVRNDLPADDDGSDDEDDAGQRLGGGGAGENETIEHKPQTRTETSDEFAQYDTQTRVDNVDTNVENPNRDSEYYKVITILPPTAPEPSIFGK
jgi:hypothetical protein